MKKLSLRKTVFSQNVLGNELLCLWLPLLPSGLGVPIITPDEDEDFPVVRPPWEDSRACDNVSSNLLDTIRWRTFRFGMNNQKRKKKCQFFMRTPPNVVQPAVKLLAASL